MFKIKLSQLLDLDHMVQVIQEGDLSHPVTVADLLADAKRLAIDLNNDDPSDPIETENDAVNFGRLLAFNNCDCRYEYMVVTTYRGSICRVTGY